MMEKTIQWIRKNNKSVLFVIECYRKVNKECFKFIKSQETSKDKFKNKDKMIKSFLIPVSFWIAEKAEKKKPYIVGLSGGQGTGKTTISSIISIILRKFFKLNVFTISIDDFYKTASFVAAIENRQGLKIACIEEIAYLNKWISKKHIHNAIKFYGNCDYSKYLKKIASK